jgi:hypothetical protein
VVTESSTSYDSRPGAAVDRCGLPTYSTETSEYGRGTTVPLTIPELDASLCRRRLQLSVTRWTV